MPAGDGLFDNFFHLYFVTVIMNLSAA